MTIGAHAVRGLLGIRGLNGPEGPLPRELTDDDSLANHSSR